MKVDQSIPIIPASVANEEGIKEALDALLEILYR
jgi:hypothetical protein